MIVATMMIIMLVMMRKVGSAQLRMVGDDDGNPDGDD